MPSTPDWPNTERGSESVSTMTVNQDDELTALRAQRMKELQSQIEHQAAKQLEAEEKAQQEATDAAQVDAVLRRHLSPEARARLARIALVEPKRVQSIKADLAAMVSQGPLTTPMSDASLKQLLTQLSKSRSNASVRRIREGARYVKKQTSSKENPPLEGRKAKPACPRLGHAQDRPKHRVAPKATPMATQQVAAMR